MKLYPAIDLKSGQCVRLYQGSFEQVTQYHTDPITMAQLFLDQGAQYLHVVDLDGAKTGEPAHTALIADIVQTTGLQVQVGGGIRHVEQIHTLFAAGVKRVILGSVAMSQPQQVQMWLEQFTADSIVLALDVRMDAQGEPQLAAHGWQTDAQLSLWDLLDQYCSHNTLQHVLCTDIGMDGTLKGPNLALYQTCQQHYPQLQFQASGGVGSLADLHQLATMGVAGVIVGKALYEKKFTLKEALAEVATC